MPQYLIQWNSGYGDSYKIVDVESKEQALEWAHDEWKEEAESNADYSATLATDDDKETYGL